MIIIGITGTLGAGKGTIVEYLVGKKGFKHYSVRELLSEIIRAGGQAVNRDTMVETANRMREQHGPGFLVEELFRKAQDSQNNCIIESIRTEGEINSLRKKGNFYLISVDASPEVRYQRVVARGSETDRVSFEKFLDDEKREMGSSDPTKQNLHKCIALADFKVKNDGSIEDLEKTVNNILQEIENDGKERKK